MALITIVTGAYKPTNITGGGGTLYIFILSNPQHPTTAYRIFSLVPSASTVNQGSTPLNYYLYIYIN